MSICSSAHFAPAMSHPTWLTSASSKSTQGSPGATGSCHLSAVSSQSVSCPLRRHVTQLPVSARWRCAAAVRLHRSRRFLTRAHATIGVTRCYRKYELSTLALTLVPRGIHRPTLTPWRHVLKIVSRGGGARPNALTSVMTSCAKNDIDNGARGEYYRVLSYVRYCTRMRGINHHDA